MKIVYVAHNKLPAPSASSLQVMKMCEAFANNGDEVVLVAGRGPNANSAAVFSHYGVKPVFRLHRLPRSRRRGGKHLFGMFAAALARRYRADLVHGRCIWSCQFAARLAIPVSYELHTLPRRDETRMQAVLRLADHPAFRALIVTSEVLRQDLLEQFPTLMRCPVVVAPNGADPRTEPDPAPLPTDGLNVGYIGRLYPGKGAEVVLALAESCPWAQFHVVGGTRQEIDHLTTRSAALANVHFYEFLPHSGAMRYVDACDVLVAPYQETVGIHGGRVQSGRWMTPIKIFEYMAAGKPIIASDLPVAREILSSGETGFLCPPDDVQAWKQTLDLLNASPELRKQIGENARRRFLSQFTWSARASKIRGLASPAA